MKWFIQHKFSVIIAVIILILFSCIGLTSHGRANSTVVEGVVSEATSPVGKFFYSSSQYVKNVYKFIIGLHDLQQRNEELEKLVDEYEMKIADYDEKVQENNEMKALLDFKDENKSKDYISASIIGIDPYEGFQSFVIDKGSANGVKENMTIVLAEGLVGRVSEVSVGTSKVLSIIDTESMFNGRCVRTNDYIRISGDSNNDLIGYVDFEAKVKEGDLIVTSGLSGIFPKDIIVGKITEVLDQQGKMEKRVRIVPSVDIEKINKVLIIK